MKRFAFALEKILEYRRQVELDRRRAFSKAVEIFRRREEQLRALAGELELYRTRMAQMGTGKISTRDLALHRTYLTHVESQIEQAVVWLQDAGKDLEARRQDLVASSKDRRVLETVKERKRADYEYEANRQETKELDEVGATRHTALAGSHEEEAQ